MNNEWDCTAALAGATADSCRVKPCSSADARGSGMNAGNAKGKFFKIAGAWRPGFWIALTLIIPALFWTAKDASAGPPMLVASTAAPPFGGQLVLDYTNPPAYANANDHAELDVVGSLTVEAWVYYQGDYRLTQVIADKSDAYLLSVGYSGSARCIGFQLWPASGAVGGAIHCKSPRPYRAGWHHIAGVFRAETGEVKTYIDGRLYSGPYSFVSAIKNSPYSLQVGYNLVGALDEVRISDVARYTDSTYNVPTAPFACDTNTRALWHFDEPQGATVFHDACGADNVLVGYNGAHTVGAPAQIHTFLPVVSR
jgi:hypothetical protein